MDDASPSAPKPEASKQAKPPRRRRRRSRPPQGRAPRDPQTEALRILDGLESIAQTLLRGQGQRLLKPESFILPIQLTIGAGDAERRDAAAALVAALSTRLKEAHLAREAFVMGEVYSFRDDVLEGALSPPGPRDVFAGFGATGIPEWVDFPNLCLARGEPETSSLFGDAPAVLALVMEETELMGRLLPAFGRGSRAYRLLGQVVAGLLPPGFSRRGQGKAPIALTVQAVETRGDRGTPWVRLNILGVEPGAIAEAAAEADPRDPAERLHRALQKAAGELKDLGRKAASAEARGESLDLGPPALQILGRLRSEIPRIYRRDGRRTQHAQARHRVAERPTASALKDAKAAGQERLLFDARQETIVVLGPRGRAHLFSLKGKHVTSLTLEPGEVDRKMSRGRWRLLSPKMVLAFKGQLLAGSATGES